MRDYLTNLAARSLDSTPAIQPRLTSLFEPVRNFKVIFPDPGLAAAQPATFEEVVPDDIVANRRPIDLLIEQRAARQAPQSRVLVDAHTEHISEPARPRAGFEEVASNNLVPDRRANNLLIEPLGSSRQATPSRVLADALPEHIDEPARRLTEPERSPRSAAIQPVLQPAPIPEKPADEAGNRGSSVSGAAPATEKPVAPIVVPLIAFSSADERAEKEGTGPAESARRSAKAEIDTAAIEQTREASRPALEPQQHKPIAPRISDSRTEPRADRRPKVIVPTDEAQQGHQSTSRLVVPRIVIEQPRVQQNQPPAVSTRESPAPPVSNVTKSSTAPLDSSIGSRSRRQTELDIEPVRPDEAVEQVINVTIGRVEIRAELPTTTRQKVRSSTSSSSLMSLDDYLRQRAQGGKR